MTSLLILNKKCNILLLNISYTRPMCMNKRLIIFPYNEVCKGGRKDLSASDQRSGKPRRVLVAELRLCLRLSGVRIP